MCVVSDSSWVSTVESCTETFDGALFAVVGSPGHSGHDTTWSAEYSFDANFDFTGAFDVTSSWLLAAVASDGAKGEAMPRVFVRYDLVPFVCVVHV